MSCRRYVKELETIGMAMGLRAHAESLGEGDAVQGLIDAYYRASRPEEAMESWPVSRADLIHRWRPFRAALADESLCAMWAAMGAAEAEVGDLSIEARTALSLARMAQV